MKALRFLLAPSIALGMFFMSAAVVSASATYNFNSDTIGQTPSNTTVTAGTFDVINDGTLGYSLRAVTQTGVIAGINFDSFASSTDYSVTWKQSYADTSGRSGFTLRAQGTDTAVANSAGARLGYLFHVYDSNSVYIWKVGSGSYTALWSGTLPKSSPRWYRATVQGTLLSFYYSDNGSSYTLLATTTDSTYTSGIVQYTAGYGASVNKDYVDDVVITSLTQTSVDGASSYTGQNAIATPINNLQISGIATTTIPVKLLVTSGTLAFGSVTGLTFTSAQSGSTLYFSGSMADINAALSTLTYTRSGTGTDTLEVSLVSSGEVFFTGNNHLYEYISSTLTWTNARTAAAALSKYGAAGYLTTVTSQSENDFVAARLSNAGWMGASDSALEGDWKWVVGPETGTSFWSGLSGGSTVGGNYANWGSGEPNDSGSNEDCAQFLTGGSGKWNDLPCNGTTLPGYVVEYGTPGTLPTVSAKNISITTNDAPAVTTLTPSDNATTIGTSTNLTILFNKIVTRDTGYITIKNSSDNSTFETINVASSTVTGSGSNTIVINPVANLAESTGYYVLIDATAFKDGGSLYYAGISSSSTWNFTTGDFTAPVISSVASSTSSTVATTTWTTNELASSRLYFGTTNAYGSSTALTDTSPRVTSHTVALSNLIPCTTYYFQVISTDASSNTSTSTGQQFNTSGCTGSVAPLSATSTTVTVASAATTTHSQGDSTITVATPSNFTSTSSSVVIQIQGLTGSTVLDTLGKPSSFSSVGPVVFDVKAIIDSTTVLDSFNAPVTISYHYSDVDIAGLNESTLRLYHYHSGAWSALDNCTIDQAANNISCTSPSFSIFSLFGQSATTQSSGGGIPYGCTDANATNYNPYVVHKSSLCTYASYTALAQNTPDATSIIITQSTTTPELLMQAMTEAVKAFPAVRDLKVGMQGDDVRALQTLLMNEGYSIKAGATSYFVNQTKNALSKYQKDHGIIPAVGYFGVITRTEMKGRNLNGTWW